MSGKIDVKQIAATMNYTGQIPEGATNIKQDDSGAFIFQVGGQWQPTKYNNTGNIWTGDGSDGTGGTGATGRGNGAGNGNGNGDGSVNGNRNGNGDGGTSVFNEGSGNNGAGGAGGTGRGNGPGNGNGNGDGNTVFSNGNGNGNGGNGSVNGNNGNGTGNGNGTNPANGAGNGNGNGGNGNVNGGNGNGNGTNPTGNNGGNGGNNGTTGPGNTNGTNPAGNNGNGTYPYGNNNGTYGSGSVFGNGFGSPGTGFSFGSPGSIYGGYDIDTRIMNEAANHLNASVAWGASLPFGLGGIFSQGAIAASIKHFYDAITIHVTATPPQPAVVTTTPGTVTTPTYTTTTTTTPDQTAVEEPEAENQNTPTPAPGSTTPSSTPGSTTPTPAPSQKTEAEQAQEKGYKPCSGDKAGFYEDGKGGYFKFENNTWVTYSHVYDDGSYIKGDKKYSKNGNELPMEESDRAVAGGYKPSDYNGFYTKGRDFYKYDAKSGKFEKCDILYKNGQFVVNGKTYNKDGTEATKTVDGGTGSMETLAFYEKDIKSDTNPKGKYEKTQDANGNTVLTATTSKGSYSYVFDSSGKKTSYIANSKLPNGSTRTTLKEDYRYDQQSRLVSTTRVNDAGAPNRSTQMTLEVVKSSQAQTPTKKPEVKEYEAEYNGQKYKVKETVTVRTMQIKGNSDKVKQEIATTYFRTPIK